MVKLCIKKRILLLVILFLFMVLVPLLSVRGDGSQFEHTDLRNNDTNSFCILDESTGEILAVPDKNFVLGTVASEMPAEFEPEALKAQAVASYTYFCRARNNWNSNSNSCKQKYMFSVNQNKSTTYMSEEQMKQKWGSRYEEYSNKISQAVESVFGEIIKDEEGEPILAVYHAVSAGQTENASDVFGGESKYLSAVSSPGDKLAQGYKTTVSVDADKFKNIILDSAQDCSAQEDASLWVGEINRSPSGGVKTINVCSHIFKGAEIRKLFALRSANFDIEYNQAQNKFNFTVRGYGHGVGMSQRGAEYMAKQGADYKKILEWYYPRARVEKINM